MRTFVEEEEGQLAFWSSGIGVTDNCPQSKKCEPFANECYWKSAHGFHDFDGGGTFALRIMLSIYALE